MWQTKEIPPYYVHRVFITSSICCVRLHGRPKKKLSPIFNRNTEYFWTRLYFICHSNYECEYGLSLAFFCCCCSTVKYCSTRMQYNYVWHGSNMSSVSSTIRCRLIIRVQIILVSCWWHSVWHWWRQLLWMLLLFSFWKM